MKTHTLLEVFPTAFGDSAPTSFFCDDQAIRRADYFAALDKANNDGKILARETSKTPRMTKVYTLARY